MRQTTATVGFINIDQNQRVSKLTTISVVFMPIAVVAGMSGFSMMTKDFPWHGAFIPGMVAVGRMSFAALRFLEKRQP